MRTYDIKRLLVTTAAILAVSLISFGSCTDVTTEPPPPMQVSIDQIYADYVADWVAADAKYKGQGLLFRGVVVERFNTIYDEFIMPIETYVMSGSVKFVISSWEEFQGLDFVVKEGVVLDIVGEVYNFNPVTGILTIGKCSWQKA